MESNQRRVISLLVDNQSGVLARVSNLFCRRGFNIDSLTVSATNDPTVSRITVSVSGTEKELQQLILQTERLEVTRQVFVLNESTALERELLLLKVMANVANRAELREIAGIYKAKIIDLSPDSMVFELTGRPEKIDAFLKLMADYQILEQCRTGVTALERGGMHQHRLVFGSGKSGIGAAELLAKVGAQPVIYDGNKDLDKETVIKKVPDCNNIEVYAGELPEEVQKRLDLAVLSPGVPTDIPLVKSFYEQGLPVWGEVELAYRTGKGRVLAITGTNGKTTTTALLGKIMSDAEDSVFVVGNIGTPYTSKALEMKDSSTTVAEISSFQLETIEEFAPKVSAILNITEDHLNRHHTMEEYIRVKELIVKNQTAEDYCILNYEDEVLREFGRHIVPKTVYFSSVRKLDEGIYLDGDLIVLKTADEEIPLVHTGELKLLGQHNFENVMAASAMAYYAGVSVENIRKSICAFTAVEHRIEYVMEKNGVAYYNDSKGTNPDAAIKGIQAMNRPTLLIGGGYDKGSSYDEWLSSFDGKVRYLVLIGQTRDKIKEAAERLGVCPCILCENLEEAVKICAEKANPGDAVLLSPACASWGQFDNYEQRGDMFKEYVRAL